jgi:hypothetical protein
VPLMPRTKIIKANPKHDAFYEDVVTAARKHDLPPEELLIMMSNILGKILALQDQRRRTKDDYLRLMSMNIEQGNAEAVIQLMSKRAGSA